MLFTTHGSSFFELAGGDSAVGTSGKPIRVYNVTWLSDGTARDLVLRNGTADTDTAYTTEPGTISKTKTINFEQGLRFPSGCFLDIGDVVSAVIEWRLES